MESVIKWDIEYHENGKVRKWIDKRDIKTILLAFLKKNENDRKRTSKPPKALQPIPDRSN